MLRVLTLNVNGLRAALSKGLRGWLARQRADVICLQEVRLGSEGVPQGMSGSRWHASYCPALKPGYSGTAVLSRIEPKAVQYGFGVEEFDDEGRYVVVDLGALSVASLYAPSGSSGEHRQASKDRFLVAFEKYRQRMLRAGRSLLVCGDINIAHTKKDLRNWRSNQTNSGFLEHERRWMDRWVGKPGAARPAAGAKPTHWCDVFRLLNDKEHQYTWWSNRGRAWENNVGWRLDYQIATNDIARRARREKIYKDRRFSDHSPVIIDYDIDIDIDPPSPRTGARRGRERR